jgi:RimJ/RimL family protein N-acetyltransferase
MWCHLVSDTSYDELHRFTKDLGIPRLAFQGDHYDLHETGRARAIEHGATPVNSREIVRALRNAGLRRGPRFATLADVSHLPAPTIETERLVLRQWTISDVPSFAAIDADPNVMALLGGPRSPEKSMSDINREAVRLALTGVGKWVVEERATGELIGRVGLGPTDETMPFRKSLEIAWRLRAASQGFGYATEAARASLNYAFSVLNASEVIAVCARINVPSQAVMQRLGMLRDEAADFDHPAIAAHDPLRPHVLYRVWHPSVSGGRPDTKLASLSPAGVPHRGTLP